MRPSYLWNKDSCTDYSVYWDTMNAQNPIDDLGRNVVFISLSIRL